MMTVFSQSETQRSNALAYVLPLSMITTSANGKSAAFAGADSDALGKLHDKDFTIAD